MQGFMGKCGCKGVCCLLAVAMLLGLPSCGKPTASQGDVLTQQSTEAGKTQITVLVKYAFSINGFEEVVEKKFPEIDIVQVGNYTRDMGIAEYEARMEHDDLPDVVMTWPLDVGKENWGDRLLDLSGMEFTSRYNLSMLNSIAQDGQLYYLPGPAQVRGILYNKTLFKENGWEVPSDFEGFISLCKTIEESGMRSIQLGFGNAEVLDTAFVGYNFGNFFSKPQDLQWFADYNNGTGSYGEHFGGALDVFQRMIDEGIWKPSDLDVQYPLREKMMFTRKCAMVEDSVLMARMGFDQTGTTDEFALMPFFNPDDGGDWARLYMVCYIGLNKHLADSENKKKYELVMQLMDYISTPEGQEALASDTGAMFSSLSGVQPPDIPEIVDLRDSLSSGRYAIFPELKNAQSALRDGLAGMLRGDTTKQEVIAMVDKQNLAPSAAAPPEKLGSASADFTVIETGNFVTDAMRAFSGCEIALFLDNGKDGKYNGKGISARLYGGDVTALDIKRILPDLKHGETGTLWKITMSGKDLLQTLEYTISVDNGVSGWFYYFSGLRMEYDPAAEPGSRIKQITTADKQTIDPEKLYAIAVMDETVPPEFIKSCDKTDVTIMDIVSNAVRSAGTISPGTDGRFKFPS